MSLWLILTNQHSFTMLVRRIWICPSYEEADTQMFLHCHHSRCIYSRFNPNRFSFIFFKKGHHLIRRQWCSYPSSALFRWSQLQRIEGQIWSWKNKGFLAIHEMVVSLGPKICSNLTFSMYGLDAIPHQPSKALKKRAIGNNGWRILKLWKLSKAIFTIT